MRLDVGNLMKRAAPSAWHLHASDGHLVSLRDPDSPEAEHYRMLRHMLEHIHPTKKVLAVTSAVAGDGKTTTALNLAGALAQAPDARILLVDLDLRTATAGDRVGLRGGSPGLVDVILDPDLVLADVVRPLPPLRLSILPAGRSLAVPYELLKSARLRELLQEARRQYDYLILDTPPLVPVPDCGLIADQADGLLIVVAAHRTPRPLLAEALDLVDATKLVGIVFNGDDRRLSRYYGYYYGYGRRARRGAGWWASLLARIPGRRTRGAEHERA